MVLHLSNFEIPARFSFQPYSAKWRGVSCETLEWVEEPKLRAIFEDRVDNPEKDWLRIRIDTGSYGGLEALYGDEFLITTVLVDRASIPQDKLRSHENWHNAPDISGRFFTALICRRPEFKNGLWDFKPGEATKNAWIMRDEFLSLEPDPEPGLGWDWSVRRFLDKWGIWKLDRGYSEDGPSSRSLVAPIRNTPDFMLVMPHLLKEQQEKYSKALLPSNRREWLRSHPLQLGTLDMPPFFLVSANQCSHAIETTITIDHLAERQFGICKRCHTIFQKETKHRKTYCSERCFNAAGVQRWRDKQRKAVMKETKRNAKG